MKYIKSVSFSPIIQQGTNGWTERMIVVFEMISLWKRDNESVEEISWVEFNSDVKELEFIITKLQSVVDKSKAAYKEQTKEVKP